MICPVSLFLIAVDFFYPKVDRFTTLLLYLRISCQLSGRANFTAQPFQNFNFKLHYNKVRICQKIMHEIYHRPK